jgi:signal transduction histidine kinase
MDWSKTLERRVVLLRDLGARSSGAKTAAEACAVAAECLDRHPEDVPFGLLYLISDDREKARLAGAAGIVRDDLESWREIDLGAASSSGKGTWPLAEAAQSERVQVVTDLALKLPRVPAGPWADPPTMAVVLPIRSNIAHPLAGLLVLGVSSRLTFDDHYRGFFELISSLVAAAIASARAFEEERRHAEALAEIERLRESERRFRSLVESMRVSTMVELAASIAHEVKQPLAAIALNGSACVRWLGARPPNMDEAKRTIEHIVRDANRAADVITRIRTFLKRGPTQQASVNVNEVIADVVAMVQTELRSNNVSLVLSRAERFPAVHADPTQLQQVILSLVMNAIDAMRPLAAGARVLRISTGQHGPEALCISVCDTGVGLASEHGDRIFDAFCTTKQDGMGMGLAISRSIVEAHGGRLWATQNEGPGASFHLTLPFAIVDPA